jgi:hypothetical protein
VSVASPEISFPQYFTGPHAEDMQRGLQMGLDEFAGWLDRRESRVPYKGITVAMYSFDDTRDAVERSFESMSEQILVDQCQLDRAPGRSPNGGDGTYYE